MFDNLIITLTQDVDLKAKLVRKLAEYEGRMKYKAPETDPDNTYRLEVLKALLEEGVVNATDFLAKMDARFEWTIRGAYSDAINLIDAYNRNDLSKVTGGTGLN